MGDTNKTALVLGATGGIGGAVAAKLLRRGWTVRALRRGSSTRPAGNGPEWIAGDAMNGADVRSAARGTSLIVHAVNPPGYWNWGTLVPPMLDNTIAAAEETGARIVLPGGVYNYGPDAFPNVAEDAPQHPISRKGVIRVEMERRLERAADRGVRMLIVRAGDFFGPAPGGSWFSQGLVKPGRPVTAITTLGRPGVGHQWAYLPDVAETIAELVGRDLNAFERFNMDGHWDADGTAMSAAIRAAVGRSVPVKALPWWLLRLASRVVPVFREMAEMRYLWRTPIRLDNRLLVRTLGAEPHTPLDFTVRATLVGLGCIPNETA